MASFPLPGKDDGSEQIASTEYESSGSGSSSESSSYSWQPDDEGMMRRLMGMEFVPGAIQFGPSISPALTLQQRSKEPTPEEMAEIEAECRNCALSMKRLIKKRSV